MHNLAVFNNFLFNNFLQIVFNNFITKLKQYQLQKSTLSISFENFYKKCYMIKLNLFTKKFIHKEIHIFVACWRAGLCQFYF